jgi:hypothetical protein
MAAIDKAGGEMSGLEVGYGWNADGFFATSGARWCRAVRGQRPRQAIPRATGTGRLADQRLFDSAEILRASYGERWTAEVGGEALIFNRKISSDRE